MILRINFKSGKPAHLQVVDEIKAAAASGALRAGEALPSIASLAEELRVNRNVIAKAYAELETTGLIETFPGKPYILREHHPPSQTQSRRKLLMADIDQTVVQAPRAIRKTLTYSLLTALLAVLYLGLVGSIGALLIRAGIVRGELVAVFSTVIVAAVFMPLRGLVQDFVDRIVFAKRYEFPRALQAIKAEAPLQPDVDSFMRCVIEKTERVMDCRLDLIRDYSEMLSLVNAHPSLRAARAPIQTGAALLMPLFSDNELFGILRLVANSADRVYDAEEFDFLSAAGEQIVIAVNQFRLRKETQESEYALEIQRGLLPREIPQIPGFTIAGAWQPARTVGGDYYDVIKLSDAKVALVLADVSGKGIPAALLMANLQALVKAYADAEISPKNVCVKINRAVCNNISPGKFITFFYAVLDSAARRLTYTNAGHNPPLVSRQDGSCLGLETGGAVLGIFPDWTYDEAAIELQPGDRMVICTDGITEASDSNGEEFGEERLIEILGKNPAATAADLRDAIMHRVAHFCRADFADDATLLVVMGSAAHTIGNSTPS